ncbi:hypothetical protein [Methanogenium sp. MK-MG]|uniref:hypothetical protein n=1 Tax=Methanogenium sp. MK-MG TaxID=2599926 RepID=UPI0013EE0560|nr:hypothetical protein [Methanogenium sp. MK-MG]
MGIRPQLHHPVVSGGNCHHLPGMALPAVLHYYLFSSGDKYSRPPRRRDNYGGQTYLIPDSSMTPGKRLTIGVTVNLERYENLRVAVEGDVNTREDAEMLARYLDDVLAGFGKNDPETEKQIANYRFRVLPGRGDAADDTVLSERGKRDAESYVHAGMPVQSDTQTGGVMESGACAPAVPAQAETSLFCADCGVSISKQEDKLGRIFVDRPLCRACLDIIQKAQH